MRISATAEELWPIYCHVYGKHKPCSTDGGSSRAAGRDMVLLAHWSGHYPLPLHLLRTWAPRLFDLCTKETVAQGGFEAIFISLPPEVPGRALANLHDLLIKGVARVEVNDLKNIAEILKLLQMDITIEELEKETAKHKNSATVQADVLGGGSVAAMVLDAPTLATPAVKSKASSSDNAHAVSRGSEAVIAAVDVPVNLTRADPLIDSSPHTVHNQPVSGEVPAVGEDFEKHTSEREEVNSATKKIREETIRGSHVADCNTAGSSSTGCKAPRSSTAANSTTGVSSSPSDNTFPKNDEGSVKFTCGDCKTKFKLSFALKRHICSARQLPSQSSAETEKQLQAPTQQPVADSSHQQLPMNQIEHKAASDSNQLSENQKTPTATAASFKKKPMCRLCGKQCLNLRRLKEHYVLGHFEAEFQALYASGRRISSSERGELCGLSMHSGATCTYSGSTRDLVLHVGIVHAKLRDFVSEDLWSSLFGNSNTAVEKPKTDIRGSKPEQSKVKNLAGKKATKPVSSGDSKAAGAMLRPDGQLILRCHICRKRFLRLRLLKQHYVLSHYKANFAAKHLQGKAMSRTERHHCELCDYAGTTRDVAVHLGTVHGRLKDHLPEYVWTSLFGHQVRRRLKADRSLENQENEQPEPNRKDHVAAPLPGRQSLQQKNRVKSIEAKTTSSVSSAKGGPYSCHMCQTRCTEARALKKHYILVHFLEDFKAQYTQGKRFGEEANCELCSEYSGRKARDVAFHAGIVHQKLINFLPPAVASTLFEPPLGRSSSRRKKRKAEADVGLESKIAKLAAGTYESDPTHRICHICGWRCFDSRSMKKHYILNHFAKDFRDRYTRGSSLSLSNSTTIPCPLCKDYSGTARKVAFHVGLVHRKLTKFLPTAVASSLFRPTGFASVGVGVGKVAIEGAGENCTATGEPAVMENSRNPLGDKLKTEGSSRQASTGVVLSRSSSGSWAAKQSSGDPSTPASGNSCPRVGTSSCHLCLFTGYKSDLRRHYMTHYKADMYARYSKASFSPSGEGLKPNSRLEECDYCSFRGMSRSLIDHYWTTHQAIKEFIPVSVWSRIKPSEPGDKRPNFSMDAPAGNVVEDIGDCFTHAHEDELNRERGTRTKGSNSTKQRQQFNDSTENGEGTNVKGDNSTKQQQQQSNDCTKNGEDTNAKGDNSTEQQQKSNDCPENGEGTGTNDGAENGEGTGTNGGRENGEGTRTKGGNSINQPFQSKDGTEKGEAVKNLGRGPDYSGEGTALVVQKDYDCSVSDLLDELPDLENDEIAREEQQPHPDTQPVLGGPSAAEDQLLECPYCAGEKRRFECTAKLRRHLVLGHFKNDFCHDFNLSEDLLLNEGNAPGFSCWLCECCFDVSLDDLLLHLGVGHRKLDAYLPKELRQQLA